MIYAVGAQCRCNPITHSCLQHTRSAFPPSILCRSTIFPIGAFLCTQSLVSFHFHLRRSYFLHHISTAPSLYVSFVNLPLPSSYTFRLRVTLTFFFWQLLNNSEIIPSVCQLLHESSAFWEKKKNFSCLFFYNNHLLSRVYV